MNQPAWPVTLVGARIRVCVAEESVLRMKFLFSWSVDLTQVEVRDKQDKSQMTEGHTE